MRPLELLNLLIIDDNQLYAEQLIGVLEQLYYKKVNLGFLDAKDELLKSLRQSWDVLIMGKAYDLTLPQVVNILAEQGCDLPVIAILPTEQELMSLALSPKEQRRVYNFTVRVQLQRASDAQKAASAASGAKAS